MDTTFMNSSNSTTSSPHKLSINLVHFNIVNNDYQHYSRVLYIFIPNKSFSQLLDVSPKALYFQKYIYICKML